MIAHSSHTIGKPTIMASARTQLSIALCCAASVSAVAFAELASSQTQEAHSSPSLRPPSAFSDIADQAVRSRALFNEAAKVITSPRCINCHPAGNHPLQGDDEHLHQPLVARGDADDGIAGLHCAACHTDRNVAVTGATTYESIPGNARWSLAPIEMAWQGKSIGEICEQIKDPARNGGRSLALLHEHTASDDVVAHAWAPGAGRTPAPGSQRLFGDLIAAWIDTGAVCPPQ
jgi:hypothetical protein